MFFMFCCVPCFSTRISFFSQLKKINFYCFQQRNTFLNRHISPLQSVFSFHVKLNPRLGMAALAAPYKDEDH